MSTFLENIDWSQLSSLLTYDPQAPMIFSSGFFLWLFTAFLLVYALLQRADTARLIFVTAFSYYFYYKSSGTYFFLLAVVTCSDYFIAHRIDSAVKDSVRRAWVALSVGINIGLLVYFKYTNFFASVFSPLWTDTFEPFDIFLPVGISFFTFQSLSYTIDVYRREIKPLHVLLDYAFFVSFFPQLVAGPIVRAKDFIPQIRQPLTVTGEMMSRGLFLILMGVIKKAIISDYISVNFVERIFDNPSLYSGVENLLGVYGYALQIYCDFSGYSDMAIGIALLLGFHFNINFDSPYQSASITEFWRRWHISLSSWLRDYLYIPLGGNRKGKFRQYVNLFITMFLGGLWHGASWNFLIWGSLHGVALAVHKLYKGAVQFPASKVRKYMGVVLTFHFVCFCWIFFRHASFTDALSTLHQIVFSFHPQLFMQVVEGYPEVFGLMLFGFLLHFAPHNWTLALEKIFRRLPLLLKVAVAVLIAYVVIQMQSSEVQPFIYFQF